MYACEKRIVEAPFNGETHNMTKTLVIAEKPSVAQDIVRALTPVAGKFDKHEDHFENDRYVVTSAVGHLVEIQAPEEFDVKRGKWSFAHLPVIPPYFDLKPVDKTKSRLSAVVRQAKRKDVTQLINACDAGREGELIFRLIEQYAGGSKPLNNLDMRHAVDMMGLLRRTSRELGKTVILVLHDINFASCYADRIVAMRGGKVAYHGTPLELIQPEVLRDLYQLDIRVHEVDGQRICVYY